MGGTLDEEIGDLPVDILDRSSDVSEVEVQDRSKAKGAIAVESLDNSDREVDVENDDAEGPSLSPSKPIRTNNPKPASTSDTRLLATVLDDLKDIVQPHCSFDSRKEPFQPPCKKHEGQSSQPREDLPQDLEVNDLKDENLLPPQPDLENTKTSLVGPHNSQRSRKNGSPQLSLSDRIPLCPSDVVAKLSVDQDPNLGPSQIDSDHVSPTITTLKKHFAGSLELRGVPVSTGFQPSPLLVSSESQSGAPDIEGSTTDFCKTSVDSHLSSTPEKSSPGADCSPHPNLTNSLILQSGSKVTSSHCGSALLPSHHSLSTDPGWSEEGAHHSASTVRGSESSNVSCAEASAGEATAPAAGSSSFSRVASKNMSPPVSVSSSDALTLNSFATVGSHSSQRSQSFFDLLSSNKNDPVSKRFHESTGSPNWTFDCRRPSETSSDANPDGREQPVDSNSTSSLAADRPADSLDTAVTDRRLNHTALPSSTVHINNTKRSTSSEQIVDSKHPNRLGSCYDSLLTLKNCQLSIDSKTFGRDDCLASSTATSEPVSGDIHLDSRSPVEEPSPTSIWTNSAT